MDESGGIKEPDPHHRHRLPAEIISHAVWLYYVFSLGLRGVELILAERGVPVAHETTRRWCRKFGRSFTSGLRRCWLRGRENVHKRYLIHVAGYNLGLLMRHLTGAGTPKEAAARPRLLLLVFHGEDVLAMILLAVADLGREGDCSILILTITGMPT